MPSPALGRSLRGYHVFITLSNGSFASCCYFFYCFSCRFRSVCASTRTQRVPMTRLARLLIPVAIFSFLLVPSFAVLGAGNGPPAPAPALWTNAESLDDGTRDESKSAPTGAYRW